MKYLDETVSFDLSLSENYRYPMSYALPSKRIENHHFSIVHTGDGDGWDPTRSSMSSILVYQGKIYLLDFPPHTDRVLEAFSLTINDVEGIFHTHVHDDHFIGMISLLAQSNKRIKYYAHP